MAENRDMALEVRFMTECVARLRQLYTADGALCASRKLQTQTLQPLR
jgi:hypothetical protein